MSLQNRLKRLEERQRELQDEQQVPEPDPELLTLHQQLMESMSEEHRHAVQEVCDAFAQGRPFAECPPNPAVRRLLEVIAHLEHEYQSSKFPFVLPPEVADYFVGEKFYSWSTCPNCNYPALPDRGTTPCFTYCPICGGEL